MGETNNGEQVVARAGKKPPQFNVWASLVGKKTVIQQKGGIVITGTFIGQRDNFFVLENATVVGKSQQASPPRILVERMSVAHMHEECPMEQISPIT
jgi:hypothetical protein